MTSTARAGRRRRLLHEGTANASTSNEGVDRPTGSNARFTPPAESASFAVASSVAPRSPLALLAVVAGLALVTGSLTFADRLGLGLSADGDNIAAARLLMVNQPGSLAAWWEAGLWLAVTGQCVLLFGLRRHRTDDLSGAYRWWLIAAMVAVGMSINSATQAHQVVAGQLSSLTGFSPLANGSFWWLAPSSAVLGTVGLRSLLEVKESPLAMVFAGGATVSAVIAAVAGASTVPSLFTAGLSPSLVSAVAAIAMAGCVLLTLLAYSRRIVRESLGEVERPESKKVAEPTIAEAEDTATESETSKPVKAAAEPAKSRPRRATAPAAALAQIDDLEEEEAPVRRRPSASRSKPKRPSIAKETVESKWVSGPEGMDDDYDDGPQSRKLTKAERKRLRREKARDAA